MRKFKLPQLHDKWLKPSVKPICTSTIEKPYEDVEKAFNDAMDRVWEEYAYVKTELKDDKVTFKTIPVMRMYKIKESQ
jgi:hypothetical protein